MPLRLVCGYVSCCSWQLEFALCFNHDPARLEIENTDKPWVFRSGVTGVRQCKVPVAEAGDGRARYTVRLAFAELEHDAAGQRVFDIKIQGQVVAEDFDIFQQAGGKNRAVIKEFTGIEADDQLNIDFDAGTPTPAAGQLPILLSQLRTKRLSTRHERRAR